MKVTKTPSGVRVHVFRYDVRDFARRWPGSGLADRAVTFEFDVRGDLVDIIGDHESSEALAALADDARDFARAQAAL